MLRGQLRALATLDVQVPPGVAQFPLKEMLRAAHAMQFAKHKMNNMFTDGNFTTK